ncbi:MAG: type II secretion system minor pseudopilin GspK [Proteobacteria bacterium]|nr:type II secretion system minor pseudopilin GspK [Pseudomonadota bacterium]
MNSLKKQQGVALFVTLLVVTIATLLATEIWFRNSLDISRQYNNRAFYQANHYAKGMFLWVKDILRQDYEDNGMFDNRDDIWNQPIAGIETEDAVLAGKLTDLDSKFNLNNLIINGTVNQQSYDYFARILLYLELDQSLANKIIDWIDANAIPEPNGAEDNVYLSKSPSYRTAGQYFVHISELRLIDGIDERIFQRLKSAVTVLPVENNLPTKININTASALVLRSLHPRLTVKDAINLYKDGSASSQSLDDFFLQPVMVGLGLREDEKEALRRIIQTNSQWFQARVNVQMEQNNFQKFALVQRVSSGATLKQWSDDALD